MRVSMRWFGGINYADPMPEDIETFCSRADARREFLSRLTDSYYPCIGYHEGTRAHIAYGDVDYMEEPDEFWEFNQDETDIKQIY